MRLSGMVICLDEAKRIGACLQSLSCCDEIVVIDSGSTDGTQQIVESSGARLVVRPFTSWNDQKEFGRSECRGEWVLNLDADEVVSPELAREIPAAIASAPDELGGFRIPFRNYLRDQWLKSCGFYPDPHLRLVRRERSHWDRQAVHDRLLVEGAIGDLFGHVDHYSFESIKDYLEKSNIYAEAFARDGIARGRRASSFSIWLHSGARFFRSYFLQGGVWDGRLGLVMASLQAAGTFQKYARLWELERFPEPALPPPKLGDPWSEVRIQSRTGRDPS